MDNSPENVIALILTRLVMLNAIGKQRELMPAEKHDRDLFEYLAPALREAQAHRAALARIAGGEDVRHVLNELGFTRAA